MNERSMQHSTFFIERSYAASPERVFAACSDPTIKARWFGGPDNPNYSLDFRVGGRESNSGGPPGGPVYLYEAEFRDIVPNQRIVTTYEMFMDEQRISVSVATMEFLPEGTGTKLKFAEQGVFLDGLDNAAQREHGTGELLDGLGEFLQKESV